MINCLIFNLNNYLEKPVIKLCFNRLKKHLPKNTNFIIINEEKLKEFTLTEYSKKIERICGKNSFFTDSLRFSFSNLYDNYFYIDSDICLLEDIKEDDLYKYDFFLNPDGTTGFFWKKDKKSKINFIDKINNLYENFGKLEEDKLLNFYKNKDLVDSNILLNYFNKEEKEKYYNNLKCIHFSYSSFKDKKFLNNKENAKCLTEEEKNIIISNLPNSEYLFKE